MLVPSGDQAGPPSSQSPSVIWRLAAVQPDDEQVGTAVEQAGAVEAMPMRRMSRRGGGSGSFRIEGSSAGRRAP